LRGGIHALRGKEQYHHSFPTLLPVRTKKKLFTLLDLCVSSLRRGHANLLCIVPILTDDPKVSDKRGLRFRAVTRSKWENARSVCGFGEEFRAHYNFLEKLFTSKFFKLFVTQFSSTWRGPMPSITVAILAQGKL